MFSKILIANRGEIACRIIRTARSMGIGTVAVYSEVDRDAVHVEMADEAVAIGNSPASESYLVAEKIVEACRQTGAEAVHPGYGFLSEQAGFVEALEAAGIVFIGPGAAAMQAMGDKISSKAIAMDAGVPTVPGHGAAIADAGEARQVADSIGYPVMIKASAGGGGKGMRIAHDAGQIVEGFERARSEAVSSFGDGRVFIEKFIVDPRHIEIQLLADLHGNVVHLNERECSIQRRNQKIVEEAPSPFVDDDLRAAMGEAACSLARAVGYASAGTVEFIVDANRNFFFLEMNTRLQVEHPVTELITGIDLVEEMIRVATGEKLRFAQSDIGIDGWAVESRIYAEDPSRDFMPSTGRLNIYQPPEGLAEALEEKGCTIRNDSGVVEGSEISMFYDPMIAKLCTHAPSRELAIDAMEDALNAFMIDGIAHNISFLCALMAHPRWRSGDLSTSFIAQEYPDGFAPQPMGEEEKAILTATGFAIYDKNLRRLLAARGDKPSSSNSYLRWKDDEDKMLIETLEVSDEPAHRLVLAIDGKPFSVTSKWWPGERVWRGMVNEQPALVPVFQSNGGIDIGWRGQRHCAGILGVHIDRLRKFMPVRTAADKGDRLLCPMPGLVLSINVEPGQTVAAGHSLAIVEAMKMENVLSADRDMTIGEILVKPGDVLASDDVLMHFEKETSG